MTEIKFGVVTGINPTRIKLDGDTMASNITYKQNDSYKPQISDRVFVLVYKGIYIINGRLV